jgi:hypothetical protein
MVSVYVSGADEEAESDEHAIAPIKSMVIQVNPST